jgi:hypothetical protein
MGRVVGGGREMDKDTTGHSARGSGIDLVMVKYFFN